MPTDDHDAIVCRQFSPRAHSYLTSQVHATGQDLDEMAKRIGSRPHAVALDLGSGAGYAAFRLAPLVDKVVACDLSGAMLAVVAEEAARRGLANLVTEQGAAEHLPFPPATFDLAVTRYSAHHWGNVGAGLVQLRRVLKPGALAVFMDVIAPEKPLLDTWLQGLELLRDPSHVRNYSLVEWRALLTSAGFLPGEASTFRVRLDFVSWTGRMNTPQERIVAIRSLQCRAGAEVAQHFAFEDDGSFTVDTMLITAGCE